jgi:hypothetical protein
MSDKVFSGIHPHFDFGHYTEEEKRIIKLFSNEWFISSPGPSIHLGSSSEYRYFLMKPVDNYQELFNLDREIVVVFSAYSNFLPRTFDAIDYVVKKHQKLRLEKICSVVISKDLSIQETLRNLLKEDVESQIIIPFTYEELLKPIDSYFIRNRFKQHFFSRDLFAFESPLRKDLYFFGRTDLVHNLVSRHRAAENSALFGLRRTGKTSIVFAVQRALKIINQNAVFIDCQNPSFHMRRWNRALFYIIHEIKDQLSINTRLNQEDKYSEENAPICFEQDLLRIYKQLNYRSILIIFDEIENITFTVSSTNHWANENDFIFFWQTLRSIFHKIGRVFTFMIVGTNPKCIETPLINGKDNPIFNQVPYEYIPGFDVPQTRDMVRKLGRLMGLKFDEILYSKLTEDYGGHPFLIRHVCSIMNRISDKERPVDVNRSIYEKAKQIFENEYQSYLELLISVLKQFYSDEYEMLELLAIEDYKTFKEFADNDIYFTNHLLGYGIIENCQGIFNYKIDALKKYLQKKKKYKKLIMTQEEKMQEISERRNKTEPKLRILVRNQLKAFYGTRSTKIVLESFGGDRKEKYLSLSYEELFDARKSKIFLDDLRKLIIENWECFKNIFSIDKDEFNAQLKVINKYRNDAHAKDITDDEMNYFRVSMSSVERLIKNFLE